MRSWTVRSLLLSMALVLATAMPAAAQSTQKFGVGIVFGSVGVVADYSKVFRTLANDRTLGWVLEGRFAHEGCGGFGVDCGFNQMIVQGGIRINGPLGDRLTWHGQGLVGLAHSNVSGVLDDACEAAEGIIGDFGCGSSNDIVFTPAAGIEYSLNEKSGIRAQAGAVTGQYGAGGFFTFAYYMFLGS
jgi:hypothetical protein